MRKLCENINTELEIGNVFKIFGSFGGNEIVRENFLQISAKEEIRRQAPPEILARGPLAFEAYKKALKEGKTCIKRVPVMFIGQYRTGKTSLKKSLKGEPFDEEEESTDGIERDPSYFKVSTEIWKTVEKNNETESGVSISFECHAAAQLICESLLAGNLNSQGPAESTVDSRLTDENGASISGPITADSNPEVRISDPHLSEEDIPEPVAALVKRKLTTGNTEEDQDDDKVFAILWDFGGQSVYYDTHPVFLTEKAIYMLVYDLSRNPNERAKPPERTGLYENNVDISCSKTNLEFLDFWMSSIFSFARPDATCDKASVHVAETSPRRLPPVFLVCTHADKPYCCSNSRDLALKIFGFLQRKIYHEHLFEDVFVVDNTKSGSGHECLDVRRLRREVLAVAKELPQMREAIPLKWLRYEEALQTRKENDKWIPLDEAKQIASNECSIDDEVEFSTLLNFLHDQRILIHFSRLPELEKMVILDPQWLIDVFKKIITVKRHDHSEEKVVSLWLKLEETGILDEKLIDHVWKPLFGNQENRKSLIAIMERLSLICSWPSPESSKQYLVPSMLMSPPTEDVLQLLASVKIPSLFVKFESGRVPPGLFSRLILQFFQWCNKEWKSPVNPQLFKDFAMFHIRPDEGSSVILLCHSSSIEIIFLCGNDDLDWKAERAHGNLELTTSRSIHWQLTLILECMRNEFFWLANMRYEMCVCCPVCSQSPNCRRHGGRGCEECLHFLSQSDLKELRSCNKAGLLRDRRIHIKQFVHWFPFSEETKGRISNNQRQAANRSDVDVTQTDGRPIVSRAGQSRALTDDTIESIQSQTSEPKDIMTQIQESLQLDAATQAHSEPKITRSMRSLEITPTRSSGTECQTLALPRGVLRTIQSQDTAAKDIVCRSLECLQLDTATLDNPGPETKRWIRCLATQAKSENRTDVVRYLRDITPAGTTGPLLNEDLDVRRIPFPQRKDLTFSLSGGDEWKQLAERLGLSAIDIRFLDKRVVNPCDVVLGAVGNNRYLSVGEVYDMLVDCEMPTIADIM